MTMYNLILAAVDTAEDTNEVLQKASKIAQLHNAELHVMTVVRPMTYTYAGFDSVGMSQSMANFEVEVTEHTKETLQQLIEPLDVSKEHTYVELGRPCDVIKTKAEELAADLVVVGSHGRHGLGLLLGSTSNGVLHGTPCDVLTIRIHNEE